MVRYFEGSLEELVRRHQQITTRFRRIDALIFTAVIYCDGQAQSRCCIRRGRTSSSNGITYSMTDTPNPGSFNESLSVIVGEQRLFLHPLGMQMAYGRDESSRLTFEGAAEFYWSILIAPLQR